MGALILAKFPYFFWSIALGLATIIFICVKYQYFKIKTMTDNDGKYKKFNDHGQPIQEGYPRAVWDYSFFPEFSRLWHKGEWPQFVAAILLVALLTIYLITNNQEILKLLGINFGILIGTLIKVERD